jgi:hypothetical protein
VPQQCDGSWIHCQPDNPVAPTVGHFRFRLELEFAGCPFPGDRADDRVEAVSFQRRANDLARHLRADVEIATPMTKKIGKLGFAAWCFLSHGVAVGAADGLHFRGAFPTEIVITH